MCSHYQPALRSIITGRLALAARILPILFLGWHGLGAQPLSVDPQISQFAASDGNTEVSIFLGFDAIKIPFRVDSAGYSVELPVQLVVRPRSPEFGDEVDITRNLHFAVGEVTEIRQGRVFLHQFSHKLMPGRYDLLLTVGEDVVPQPFSMEGELNVRDLSGKDGTAFSDIVLSGLITRDSTVNVAYRRAGIGIQPNPRLLFGEGLNTLHYYAEAYGPADPSLSPPETYRAFICEPHRIEPLQGLQHESRALPSERDAVMGAFDLSRLANGSYRLVLQALTAGGDVVAEREKKFFVYNPGVERRSAADEVTDAQILVSRMSEDEVDEHFEKIKIIASDDQKRRMRRMRTTEMKRRFIAAFWENRATDPGIAGAVSRQEFEFRLIYADDRYGTGNKEGWQTDRGRVIIKYGIPDDIEDKLNVDGQAPHYIWSYTNIPRFGPGMFIFADRMGFNNFELIHSDVPGERQSVDLQSDLSVY